MGAAAEVRGATAVATTFFGRARGVRPAVVDGAVGLVSATGGQPRMVFDFTITDGKVLQIETGPPQPPRCRAPLVRLATTNWTTPGMKRNTPLGSTPTVMARVLPPGAGEITKSSTIARIPGELDSTT